MNVDVAKNLHEVLGNLPKEVRLVAISKYHPNEYLETAYNEGQRIFGESHEQELAQKQETLPKDIEWHFIGHLQTNKIKQIVPFVALIHGVDSFKLLKEINKEGEKIGRIIPCLLQIHIAKEETKFGFGFEECRELFLTDNLKDLKFIQVRGLMGMATLTDNASEIHSEFKSLKSYFDQLQKEFFPNDSTFCHLSMGMSDDYKIAIEEGSSMVRIGSAIFGARVY